MKLIINGISRDILPVSELTFDQFNRIILKNEVVDLKEYISLFIDIPTDELMKSEVKSSSMPALHASIFDVNIEKQVKNVPSVFRYKGQFKNTKSLSLETFGMNYVFDLYYGRYTAKEINQYELALYAMACAIANNPDVEVIEKIYLDLSQQKWTSVLPVSFFLVKKFLKNKKGFLWLSVIFTLELKRIKRLNLFKGTRFRNLAQNLRGKSYVKY